MIERYGALPGRLKVDLEKGPRVTLVQPESGDLQLATKIIEHSPYSFEVRPRDMSKPVGARIVVGIKVGSTTP